jgi:opacity protein-like surface antigen
LFAVPVARAIDGISLELGESDSSNASVDIARAGLQWNLAPRFAFGADWHIGTYLEASFAYWDNDSRLRTNSSLVDIGLTPVLRLQPTNPGAIAPFVEAGVGAHLFSETAVSTVRHFGTSFQFGSHIGAGLRFGPRHAYDISYRYQHLSNAGIKQPNNGINFQLLRFGYHF